MTAPALELARVEKRFGATEIVRGVDLRVERGERHALIGPNGAGKSVLFNLISALMPVTSGSIALHGERITGRRAHEVNRRGLSRSFQVTNLFHRVARKGHDRQIQIIDPFNRFGGPPSEKPEAYRYRSPLFHVDQLRIPLLVHVADTDEDVTIEESMQLVDALRARKSELAETKVYRSPKGGHLFDRQVDARTLRPDDTPDQRDSWIRVWAFLERHLAQPN